MSDQKHDPGSFPKYLYHATKGKLLVNSPSEIEGGGWCESPADCGLPHAEVPTSVPGGMTFGAEQPKGELEQGLKEAGEALEKASKRGKGPVALATPAQQARAVASKAKKR